MKRFFIYTLLIALCGFPHLGMKAQDAQIQHVHPLHWWTGMEETELQILLHGKNLAGYEVSLSATDVQLLRAERTDNPNYLILYVDTKNARPQTFDILLHKTKRDKLRVPYTLKAKSNRPVNSFSAADVVYLLMPDRFANGNPKNDNAPSLREATANPAHPDGRHGGDIAGIEQNLDYLSDLGITAIWTTPVHINDQPSHSYHGYGITDYYQIDPRFGTNEEFRTLIRRSHEKGIKYIMDLVFNHCGNQNFLFADRPADDWFNCNSQYVQTNYKIGSVSDPNASQADKSLAQDGWFVEVMPDFNQKNPAVMTYLIQASLWWIEEMGIDGIRQDTYPYTDLEAMATWNKRIEREYPGFNIVGETWINHNVGVSFWQKNSKLAAPRNSELKSVMDFPLMYLLNSVVDEETNDWDRGFARMYEYLTQDGVYPDPSNLFTFLCNHDTDRFQPTEEKAANIDRYRQALALLLTLRGIPQLYYGDEIGMAANKSKGDGALRQNFPGGFPGDAQNAFHSATRTARQQAYHDFTRRLLQWRKGNTAIGKGRLLQFSPKDGVYAYARVAADRQVLVVLNGTGMDRSVELARFAEVIPSQKAYEVVGGESMTLGQTLMLPARGIAIFDFQ